MSTFLLLAYSTILLSGLMLNPMIIAFEALARTISLSLMAPMLLLMMFILTPSTLIFSNEFFTASSLPLTSAFKMTLISLTPSLILENKSSSDSDLLV